jgi:hypothetical protein
MKKENYEHIGDYSDQFLRLLLELSLGEIEESDFQERLCGTCWEWNLLETPLERFVSEN